MTQTASGPVILCVLDGWGNAPKNRYNAISNAKTPVWDKILKNYPNGELLTSGLAVGLPEGQMGNSEVGHMSMGSGRVVLQDLPRIDNAIKEKQLYNNLQLKDHISKIKEKNGTCHLLGLLSPGGVHSHQNHIVEICKILESKNIQVCVHVILDGRDTPPYSAVEYIRKFKISISGLKGVTIASITGRYWTMDRDNRWERVFKAWSVLVYGNKENHTSSDADDHISKMYASGVSDEFIEPIALGGYNGIKDGDGLLIANFRADRVREIATALVMPDFSHFSRDYIPKFSSVLGMCSYSSELDKVMDNMFHPIAISNVLGEVIACAGLKQLRIAETEKYAHVTFFFNGGEENEFYGEERILIPSPNVATYDLQPEMSAFEVAEKLNHCIRNNKFDFIAVNFANADMVGHTGDLAAATLAVEAVDKCLSVLLKAIVDTSGALLITADHGNVEEMSNSVGEPHTSHTRNPVPFVIVSENKKKISVRSCGSLCDIAPTIIELLGLYQPQEMTGTSLIDA